MALKVNWLVTALVLASPPVNSAIWTDYVGDWAISAETDEAGEFSHCTALRIFPDYGGKRYLTINLGLDNLIAFTFGDDRWEIPDQTSVVTISIDDRSFGKQSAETFGMGFLVGPWAADHPLLRSTALGNELIVTTPKTRLVFSLNGSANAIRALSDCVAEANQLAASNNPFGGYGSNQSNQDLVTDDSELVANILAILIAQSGMNDAEFLSEEAIAELGFEIGTVAWRSKEMGVIGILSYGEIGGTFTEVANSTISALTEDCNDFAIQNNRENAISGLVVRSLVTACRDESGETINTGFFMFGDEQEAFQILHMAANPDASDQLHSINSGMIYGLNEMMRSLDEN